MADAATPQVINLGENISYQEGAIVSRSLLAKKGGNITLFAFAAGQALSEHTAPFDAFVYLLEGEALVTIAGEAYQLKQADSIVLPANVMHAVSAVSEFKMLLVMIKSER